MSSINSTSNNLIQTYSTKTSAAKKEAESDPVHFTKLSTNNANRSSAESSVIGDSVKKASDTVYLYNKNGVVPANPTNNPDGEINTKSTIKQTSASSLSTSALRLNASNLNKVNENVTNSNTENTPKANSNSASTNEANQTNTPEQIQSPKPDLRSNPNEQVKSKENTKESITTKANSNTPSPYQGYSAGLNVTNNSSKVVQATTDSSKKSDTSQSNNGNSVNNGQGAAGTNKLNSTLENTSNKSTASTADIKLMNAFFKQQG